LGPALKASFLAGTKFWGLPELGGFRGGTRSYPIKTVRESYRWGDKKAREKFWGFYKVMSGECKSMVYLYY